MKNSFTIILAVLRPVKTEVNKYGSACHCYRFFFCGSLHMWERLNDGHNYKENNIYLANMEKR